MAAKKVGVLIKEARTKAGLTQMQLADRISGVTAADISKAERGDKELTDAQLKAIAKITGVTQKSLLEAPKGGTASSSAKPASSSASKPASSSSAGKTSMQLTSTEKKLVELYRAANSDTKKKAMSVLKGESSGAADVLSSLLGGASASSSSSSSSGKTDDILSALLGGSGSGSSGGSDILSALLGGGGSGGSGSNAILSALLGGGGSGKADILSALLSAKREMPEGTEGEAVQEIKEIPEDDPLKEVK